MVGVLEHLTEDEKEELGKLRADEEELRQIEIEKIQQGYTITWTIIITAIVVSVGLGVFFVIRRLRK